ncbi:hypothetical protein D9756_011094 [Leucocoprinus leucothites]|uniref:BRCT domain-containing protein n=1 Tax=Leucocoprinus leucothites TaxID=201217 RepID=A0A8H5FQ86_9AGAR|nr:hypothetical protein D9756_011094 [Leucoagaricus leucothites]
MTRGDARTCAKTKFVSAKARGLYSDSESEVEGSVGSEAQNSSLPAKGKGKGKGKGRATKSNRGLKSKSKRVSSSSEEEVEVESEREDEETSKKLPVTANVSPLRKTASVVVELPPPSARKHPLKNTYGGAANKAKKKARGDEDETKEEEEEEPPSKLGEKRESAIKKADSIFVEAGEVQGSSSTSTSRPKPMLKPKLKSSLSKPTTSSPLSSIDNTPANANSTDTTDYNTASETHEPLPARRGAAAKAEAKLKEMMPDATRYEQEAKRARMSGGWTSLWEKELERQVKDKEKEEKEKEKENRKKRASDVSGEDVEERVAKKRRRSSAVGGEEEEGEGELEVVISEVGKGKTKVKRESDRGISATASNKVYLMTTQVTLGADVALEKLGVVMASEVSQCTHLIAPNLVRTEKFLCALASAPAVLQEAWAIKSAQVKQLLPFEKFLLRDAAAEKKYRMKLSDALMRAKELKGTLLANKTFYLTAKTKVDYKLLKSVISAHGGQLLQQWPTVRQLTGHADRHIISCAEDISIWRPLAAQGVPIYMHKFLLIGVLRQELDWDLMEFRVAESV